MKVLPFKIPKPENNALIFQEDLEITFYDKLHQHEEIQISCILEGEGTLVVGDTISTYKKGDILIFGSDLPHVFKSDTSVSETSHMLSLFFTSDAFGKDFFTLEELKELKPFFKRAKHGFKLTNSQKKVSLLFSELKKKSKIEQFISLLKILKITSKANYVSLSSFIYEKKYSAIEGKRMQNVMDFTMENFRDNISLETIANVASMTKNAFCKYFKKRTNKTYFRFLNELRIAQVCKEIATQKDLPIAQIAYDAGFQNISNFNRQFKLIKGMSPSKFKKGF